MIAEALTLAFADLVDGLVIAALIGVLTLLWLEARKEERLPEAELEPEVEDVVVPAFSQFPDREKWRREAQARCDRRAA